MRIPRRITAVTMTLATVLTVAATSAPAIAQIPSEVEQGQTIGLGFWYFAADATVNPPRAGTLDILDTPGFEPINEAGFLRFTASRSFTGSATINGVDEGGRTTVIATVNVVGPRADVGATFTPRPAPGPCIQIVSGGTIGFGDVTVGATTTAATETALTNCSSGLDVDIFGGITQATSGTGPGAVVWEPVQTTPIPNQFRYRLQNSGDNVDRVLDNDSSVFVQTLPNSFTRSFNHVLTIGAGSTTGLNAAFSAAIILTATTAAP